MSTFDFDAAIESLNPEQRRAVEAIEGPVAVIAGPGTGKTQIIALRIGNILRKTQIDPHNILALTFTDAGVIAMKQRLVKLIGPTGYDVQVFTFHSFCSMVIEDFPEKFIFKKELRAIDDVTKYEVLMSILDEKEFKYLSTISNKYFNTSIIAKDIDTFKRENITIEMLKKYVENGLLEHKDVVLPENPTKALKLQYEKKRVELHRLEEMIYVFDRYNKVLKEQGFYDFSDMILYVLDKFKSDPDLLLHYQEAFHYVLADEFQDSNSPQTEILDLLVSYYKESPNLFVVGDDDQSIYKFQGASLENFNNIFVKYPSTERIVLKQNYRSTQRILDASRSLIANNEFRLDPDKVLVSNIENQGEICLYPFSTQSEEFSWIAKKILDLRAKNVNLSEIAVLSRNNSDLVKISKVFEQFEIPYSLSAKQNILKNPFVEKVISILKVLSEPTDFIEFNKVLFLEHLQISVIDILNFNNYIKQNKPLSLFEIPYQNSTKPISLLLTKFEKWYKLKENVNLPDLVLAIITDIELIEYLVLKLEKIEDFEALNAFINFVRTSTVTGRNNDVSSLLSTLRSMFDHNLSPSSKDVLPASESVQLLSAHKSKGLEFEYVFIPVSTVKTWNKAKANRTFIPSDIIPRSYENKKESEEESRRLFYVALTRAKHTIYFSYSSSYDSLTSEQMQSKFLEEIDQNLVDVVKTEPISHKQLAELLLTKPSSDYYFLKEKNKVQELVKNFKLSATNLKNFLECRKRFFLQNILRVPSGTNRKLLVGNIVHLLAEKYIKFQDIDIQELSLTAEKYTSKLPLTEDERQFLVTTSVQYYSDWTKSLVNRGIKIDPLFTEYNFENRDVAYEGIPLSGKIDVIELLNDKDKSVRVIDYKTTVPVSMGVILGTTKSSSVSPLYHQLMFYKLMAESAPFFKYNVTQGAIAFIEPVKNTSEFKTEYVNFNDQEYEEFKQLVVNTYSRIQNLEFLDFTEECTCRNCQYNFL